MQSHHGKFGEHLSTEPTEDGSTARSRLEEVCKLRNDKNLFSDLLKLKTDYDVVMPLVDNITDDRPNAAEILLALERIVANKTPEICEVKIHKKTIKNNTNTQKQNKNNQQWVNKQIPFQTKQTNNQKHNKTNSSPKQNKNDQ
jgi:hypothetical protein